MHWKKEHIIINYEKKYRKNGERNNLQMELDKIRESSSLLGQESEDET